jgi:hypothetical protein
MLTGIAGRSGFRLAHGIGGGSGEAIRGKVGRISRTLAVALSDAIRSVVTRASPKISAARGVTLKKSYVKPIAQADLLQRVRGLIHVRYFHVGIQTAPYG